MRFAPEVLQESEQHPSRNIQAVRSKILPQQLSKRNCAFGFISLLGNWVSESCDNNSKLFTFVQRARTPHGHAFAQISVGVGALAGSTVMLLTLPWC